MLSSQQFTVPSFKAIKFEALCWALSIGVGETFLSAFGIYLGASPLQIAILATVPPFVGALFQYSAIWILHLVKSRRQIITKSTRLNALIWLGIALLGAPALGAQWSVWALIVLVVCYHATYNFGLPLWSSLVGDLVPSDVRGRFFAQRNKMIGLFTFVGVVVAGNFLEFARVKELGGLGFLGIFCLACFFRLGSSYWISRYEDRPYQHNRKEHFSLWDFIRRSPHSNFARFVFFVSCINFCVALSAPFFSVYMLRFLKLSYLEFTMLSAANMATQFLTVAYWGSIADQHGNKRILNLCGFAVAIGPILWTFSTSLSYLFIVQMIVGFSWAGFNLAVSNFMFDAVTPPKRALCAAYQSLVSGAFVLAGSLCGSFLIENIPSSGSLLGLSWSNRWIALFFVSGVLRICVAGVLLRLFKEVREVPSISNRELFFRVSGIKAIAGLTFDVFTGNRKHKERS